MENQDVNSIDEMSNEGNMLSDDLFEEEENQQPAPSRQIVDSSAENTSLEEADKADEGVPEVVKEVVPHKEDPTQFEYWQGEADKRSAELEAFKDQYAQDKQTWNGEIASVKELLNPVVEPVLPPELRDSYDDPLDEVKDLKANLRYVLKDVQGIRQESAQEKQTREDQQKAANFKAYNLGQLQKQPGYDLEKANRALNYYSRAQANPEQYYNDLAKHFDFIEGQTPNTKEQEIQQRVNRQNGIAPLGVKTSEAETRTKDENSEFFDEMNNQNFGNY